MMVLTLLLQGSVPPPAPQASADCARPVYASDQLVCGNPDLARLDAELVRLLRLRPVPSGSWIEPQGDWFRRSRRCAFQARHAKCLEAAYHERVGLLSAMAGDDRPVLPCRPSGLAASMRAEGLVLHDGQGQVLGLASPASPEWRPFLEVRVAAGGYRLTDLGGRTVARCPSQIQDSRSPTE